MKKTWIKRENIYYKPFYKDKSKIFLLGIFALGIFFFIYQAFSLNKLPNGSTQFSFSKQAIQEASSTVHKINSSFLETGGDIKLNIIRGIRLFDFDAYKPNFDGKFRCLDGSKEIEFTKVNDDYCDCPNDGSDEPSTNACANGKFYCKYQKRHITGRGRDVYVSSSRVNDGICDCCDGSDEWLTAINKKCIKKCL